MDLFSLIYLVIWLFIQFVHIIHCVSIWFYCKYINSKKCPLSVPTSYTMITIFRRTTMKPAVAAGFRSNIICFLSSLDITFRRCGFGFGLEIPLGFPKGFGVWRFFRRALTPNNLKHDMIWFSKNKDVFHSLWYITTRHSTWTSHDMTYTCMYQFIHLYLKCIHSIVVL